MKFIYLASPYSHPEKDIEITRYVLITWVAARLTEKYEVSMFLPITQSYQLRFHNPNLGTTFKAWQKVDFCAIEHSDEVWVVKIDGWKESVGVTAEIEYAKTLKLPIRYIDPISLKCTKR